MSAPTTNPRQSTISRAIDRFALAPFRDALIDTTNLQRSERLIIYISYLLICLLLACVLLFSIVGPQLLSLAYQGPNAMRTIAAVTPLIASIGFVFGWALLLVGAARGSIQIWILALLFFATNLIFVRTSEIEQIPPRLIIVLPMLLLILSLRWITRHTLFGALCTAILIIGTGVALFWVTGSLEQRAAAAQTTLSLIFFIALPIWALGGLAVANLSLSLGSALVRRIRPTISDNGMKGLGLFVIFVHPLFLVFMSCIGAFFIFTEYSSLQIVGLMLVLDLVLSSILTLVWLIVLAIRRTWNARSAALFITARIVVWVFALVFTFLDVSQLNITDPVFTAIEQTAVVPPAFFFMFSLVLGVMGFFAPFANTESAMLPRTVRVPVALGAVLLVLTMMFYFLDSRDMATGENLANTLIIPTFFYLGAGILGLPLISYMLIWRNNLLVGLPEEWQQTPTAAVGRERRIGRGMAVAIIVLPVIFLVAACPIAVIISGFTPPT